MGITGGASRIQVVIDALYKADKELKELKKDLAGVDAATKKAASGWDKLDDNVKEAAIGFGKATALIVGLGIAAKKAFDLTEEGAGVNDLTDSFDRLGISIEDLNDAAGGTIAITDLMAASNKALAGTTGELREEMSDALPALIEMARAAVKLDPTLGSVDHAFMSLIAGIKKGQPLLIDNTNAIVSVSNANERWAETNGVAVDAMTDAQTQLALLAETQRAGAVMIEQVGGVVDSQADSWRQFTAETKNATDAMKANLADAALPLVKNLAEQLTLQRQLKEAGGGYIDLMMGGTDAVEERAAAQEELNNAEEVGAMTQAEYFAKLSNTADAQKNLNDAMIAYTTTQYDANAAAMDAQIAFINAAAGLNELSTAALAKQQIDLLAQSLENGTISANEFATAQDAILRQFGLLTDEEVAAQSAIDSLRGSFEAGRISAEAFAIGVQSIKAQLDAIDGRTVTVNFDFNVPSLPSAVGQVTDYREGGAFQALGGVSRGGRTMVGERGPEMVNLPAGAQVSSNAVTNNYYNTNVSTRATSGTYTQDIAMARARG